MPGGCSTGRRSGSARTRSAGELHLAQGRQAPERLHLDLAHALPRQSEPASDLLERARLRVVEPVAQDDDLALAGTERAEGVAQRLAAQRDLDLLVRQRPVPGHEVAERGVAVLADGLVEAGR